MRVKVYPVLADAVECGVKWGWHYAHKHTSDPGEDLIKERIQDEVLSAILEAFEIQDDK
jgi:hypothetical protein